MTPMFVMHHQNSILFIYVICIQASEIYKNKLMYLLEYINCSVSDQPKNER